MCQVTKGADMAKARMAETRNEIEQHRTTRCISASEANWRLLGYTMINRTPAVTLIHVHLHGERKCPTESPPLRNASIQQMPRLQCSRLVSNAQPIYHLHSSLDLIYYEPYIVITQKKDSPTPTCFDSSFNPPANW